MQDFLASSEDMTKFIATVSDAADQAREANNGTKDIALSFDEWGVWYSDKWNEQEDQWKAEAAQGLHHEPWPKSPHLLEDIYTAADAVVEGSLMITLLKHCDRVRSASRAQLVNVIAPIHGRGTRPGMAGRPRSTRSPKPPFTRAARPTLRPSAPPPSIPRHMATCRPSTR